MFKKYITLLLDSTWTSYWEMLAIPSFILSLIISCVKIDPYYSTLIFSFSTLFGIGWASCWWYNRVNYSWFSHLGWSTFVLQMISINHLLNYSLFWSYFKAAAFCLSFTYIIATIWFVILKHSTNSKQKLKSKIIMYFYNSIENITQEK